MKVNRLKLLVKLERLWIAEENDMVERWLDFIRANDLSRLGKVELE
jgi:hypothetical protein